MTEVRFYHLQRGVMEHNLPPLLAKIHSIGHRVVVKLGKEDSVKMLDSLLWSFDPNSFLPHGSEGKGIDPLEQPIWLTNNDDNPNNANVLILADGAVSDKISDYDICCEMFNGDDAEAVKIARQHWKAYKEQGMDTVYYQQNDNGGWEKKA